MSSVCEDRDLDEARTLLRDRGQRRVSFDSQMELTCLFVPAAHDILNHLFSTQCILLFHDA